MSFTYTHEFSSESLSGGGWTACDRGEIKSGDGVLSVTDGWAVSSDINLENTELEFAARAPEDAAQVQIWAGFRHYSRDYRYVVALRGGNNNHAYLARMGAEGYDKMLALNPLPFSPIPGVWYRLRVVCAGTKIAVYLGQDPTPILYAEDTDAPFNTGGISLGGSYITTEFKDVTVKEIAANTLDDVTTASDYLDSASVSPKGREFVRAKERAAYRPFAVVGLDDKRTEFSLEGRWLFSPDYEVTAQPLAVDFDDSAFHTITVPSSWVPLHAWLEGENMGKLNKGMNDTYHVEEDIRCRNQTFDYKKTWSAWYRHYIDLPEGITQKRITLDFEGIALISAVYFNGVRVCDNIGMFTPLTIDVSDHVRAGRNVLAIETHRRLSDESEKAVSSSSIDDKYTLAWDILDGEQVETDWEHREFCTNDIPHGFYGGNPGGIWKDVKLIISDKVSIDEIFFLPTLEDATIEVKYSNSSNSDDKQVELHYSLIHKTTGEYLCGGIADRTNIAAGENRGVTFKTPKVSPRLWAPGSPNLYTLTCTLKQDGEYIDSYSEPVGFKTASFDGETFMFNGSPLWIRGGNHMPAHVKPNDRLLAEKFITLALEHNVIATRTHVAPWGSAWLDAADELGILVSFEGTWSWLMLEHIPSKRSIKLWKEELNLLVRRHRNRASLFLMTMNNEMKFYLHDAPDEVVLEKGRILDGGIRVVREAAPHLPLVADSAYFRKHAVRSGRYERVILPNGLDEGDMDDPHGYYGWYNPGFFHFMNGEFGRDYCTPGRPCMSQECSVGYPRAEDGLPTRAYLFMHQTPQTTVGKKSYEQSDPKYFLSRHAMLTKELVEMFRRVEHDRTCGLILFAFETWFYNQHDYRRVHPMISAQKLKTAYQPVLASAELWGRHFYAGDSIETEVTLINDSDRKITLQSPQIEVSVVCGGQVLAAQTIEYDSLDYFKTAAKKLSLALPAELPSARVDAVLTLKVRVEGEIISKNEYDILIADQNWGRGVSAGSNDNYYNLKGDNVSRSLLERFGIQSQDLSADAKDGKLVAIGEVSGDNAAIMRKFAENGGTVILLAQKELPQELGLAAPFTEHRQEIITMNIPESSLFDGIEILDTAWFSDGRNVPYAALGRYSVDRLSRDITVYAETLEWHGYISKPTDYKRFGGTPLFAAKAGKGSILVSSIRTDACEFDPVASRLTGNVLAMNS
ncbi:MAG: hypothetical protein FWH14_04185 [Oscillospiraceae bacterium]|nr:hypothetical protein [Oscillospiraceae bacterium]